MSNIQAATFGNGCFWCTEAVFQRLNGIKSVKSGYSGGAVENPTYRAVCGGQTGHAEVIRVTFDAAIIGYEEILEVFWKTHDPTTLNRQGNDVGTQYRSVVFYHDEAQRKIATDYKQQLTEAQIWPDPIVTEISPLINFYPAEDYHDNYLNLHGHDPYCMVVVRPKVEKFKKQFADKLAK